MDSSALMLNFQRASNPTSGFLEVPSTRSRGILSVSKASYLLRISKPQNGVASCFHLVSSKTKSKSYSALCVQANSEKDFEGNANITKTANYLDSKNSEATRSSSTQSYITSNLDDVNGKSDNSLLSNDKTADFQPRVSSPFAAKAFAETNKEMIGSKEKWSSTSAKVSKSTYDPFSTTSTQQGLSASRQRVLDALRQSEKGGKLTKFGQPVVPSNLFDEPKSSEADSEPFQFSFNRGQLFLVFSFLFISSLMFGTAFLVWKVGAIHYNEY